MVKLTCMKTPTSKSVPEIKINVKSKRGASITTPEKGKISRHYQMLGGEKVRGAAAASARAFSLSTTKGSADVKKYDREICDGFGSHANRRSTGRPKKINPEIEAEIIVVWDDDDTRTYREVAKDFGLPLSTLHRWVVQRGLRRISARDRRTGATKRAKGEVAPSAFTRMHLMDHCARG